MSEATKTEESPQSSSAEAQSCAHTAPLERAMHTDTSTYKCPCGSVFDTSTGDVGEWLRQHAPHSNGQIREHSSGGPMTPAFDRTKDLDIYVY